ncbi:MAG: 4Fe-4S binding protein [Halothiobacillaceae bacterium]
MHGGARTGRPSSTTSSVERVAGALGTLVGSALRARGSATVNQLQQTQPKAVSAPVEKAFVDEARCSGCGICVRSCTAGAIQMNGVARIDADKCTGCGDCVAACPRGAISLRQLPSGR